MVTKIRGAPTACGLHTRGPHMVLGQGVSSSGAQLEEVYHHQNGFGLGFFVVVFFLFKPVS